MTPLNAFPYMKLFQSKYNFMRLLTHLYPIGFASCTQILNCMILHDNNNSFHWAEISPGHLPLKGMIRSFTWPCTICTLDISQSSTWNSHKMVSYGMVCVNSKCGQCSIIVFNTLKLRWNGCQFPDIFKCIFLNKDLNFFYQNSKEFFDPKV